MGPIPVIIDTDPGVDDILAILLALASPELQILSFIVSFGNTDIDAAYLNVLKAYQAVSRHIDACPGDRDRFPNFNSPLKPILARGCPGPLEGDLHYAQYFHGRDGLGGITDRHPEFDINDALENHPQLQFANVSGVELTLQLLGSYPERSITYIALGPLTNLALVMRQDGDLFRQKIGRIVCMGGALDVPGNTSPCAEFNFFADPFAVKELLCDSPGLPLDRFVLLPLDITTPHELPFTVYKKQVDPLFQSSSALARTPLTHFTSSFLEQTRVIMLQFGKDAMELHDIVAVWCAMQDPKVEKGEQRPFLANEWKGIYRHFQIERVGELTRGMLVIDRREDASDTLGTNRAEAEEAAYELRVLPAPVEVQTTPVNAVPKGVFCVTKTPGPDELLTLLLRRVWGV